MSLTTPPLFTILEHHLNPEVAAFMRVVFSLHDPQELEKLATDVNPVVTTARKMTAG